jgi:hypothetical protein
MAKIIVHNLATGETHIYLGITPRAAVIAAYAQNVRRDLKTWEYERNYGHLVTESKLCYSIGDFSTFQNQDLNDRQMRKEILTETKYFQNRLTNA